MNEPQTAPEFLLITGASSGIGRSMAIEMSRNHRLILGGRSEDRLRKTISSCVFPEQHLIWNYDLSDVENISGALRQFLSSSEAQVFAYVHCAALLKILPLRSLDTNWIRDAFRINVLSAVEIVRALTKKAVNHQRLKSIVFISSIASKFGARGFSAYAATKGALDALMKSLAVELAPGVRVNSVLPGALETPMTEFLFTDREFVEALQDSYPLGLGQKLDVVHAVEFLLSSKARWITGQQLVIDGGRTTNISA